MDKFTWANVRVDSTEVRAVTEWYTGIYWVPGERRTFQVHEGQRIAGTSYGFFGADCDLARESEARWIGEAAEWAGKEN